MTKINRNASCPCGSGLKYKKCCLPKGIYEDNKEEPTDPIRFFLSKQNRTLVLSAIASLLLLPDNHGKNLRLERLAWLAAKYCTDEAESFDRKAFQNFVLKHFAGDSMEDPRESVFTANVPFLAGNTVVFPGIESDSYTVLERLLLVIFQTQSNFPEDYKHLIQGVIMTFLRISNTIARQGGYSRYMSGSSVHRDKITFTRQLEKLQESCFLPQIVFERQSEELEIPVESFFEFVTTSSDVNQDYSNFNDDNPLLSKPLVQVEGGYVLAVPTSLITALNRYIFRQAERFGIYEQLVKDYHLYANTSLTYQLYAIGWRPAQNILPDLVLGDYESLYKIDTDIYGYVIYLPDRIDIDPEVLEEKIRNVVDMLSGNQSVPVKVLLLLVAGLSGDQISLPLGEMPDKTWLIQFTNFDLNLLLDDPNVNKLTLWKFAKALSEAQKKMRLFSIDSLDMFSYYLDNDESFFPSDDSVTGMMIEPGYAATYRINRIQYSDKHTIIQDVDGIWGHIPVEKYAKYGPIYNPVQASPQSWLVLDYYDSPIWIKNFQARDLETRTTADRFAEAILYWLLRLPAIDLLLGLRSKLPVEIELIFDEKMLNNDISEDDLLSISSDIITIDLTIQNPLNFILNIPWQLMQPLMAGGNVAEQMIMQKVLWALNQLQYVQTQQEALSEADIDQLIKTEMNNPKQKMLLIIPAHIDARSDPRWLPISARDIPDADVSQILQTLTSFLKPDRVIPEKIEHAEDKNKLCHEVVAGLVNHLGSKLAEYNTMELVRYLMLKNEAIIYKREYDEILIPAQIACFSDYPSEVERLKKSEENLVIAALSIRCLIEFAAAIPANGSKLVTEDNVDRLLAFMEQIFQWGAMSDAISMGLSDVEMGLLPSGRIGTGDSFTETYLATFFHAYTEEKVTDYMENFARKQESTKAVSEPRLASDESLMSELDVAFKMQFDLSLKEYISLHFILAHIATSREVSVLHMQEEALYNAVLESSPDYSRDAFDKGMHLLALKTRKTLVTPPHNYKREDIYPWRYNRELSYIRRPVYKEVNNGVTSYMFGFRHVTAALHNLLYLLFNGRFSDPKYSHLKTVSSRINNIKGSDYRREVYLWLRDHTQLKVIPHEVKIPESEYGDIDVLAWDAANNIVYSLECKNTVPARNIYEMKGELDKYFGRETDGDGGMIIKHVKRHEWLEKNSAQLFTWLGFAIPEYFKIRSLVVTAVELPVGYISRQKPPLPITSFHALKKTLLN